MKTKLLFNAALAALIFTACSSEDTSRNGNAENLKNEFSEGNLIELRQNNRDNRKQYFTIEASGESVTVSSEKGVKITVDTRTLTVNGRPVEGPVQIEYIEIFGVADMVATGMPTMGVKDGEVTPDSEVSPLITGGEFFVNMTTEGGENIDDGASYTLAVPTELTEGGENNDTGGMIVWTGEEDENGDVVWEQDTDENGEPRDIRVDNGRYIMEMLSFGWCNIDKLMVVEGERTDIWVDVPDGFNDTNSSVYLAYQGGGQNLLFDIQSFNYGIDMFEQLGGYVPVGAQFNVIFVSGAGNNWLLAVKQVTIVGNDVIVIDASDISSVSDPALIGILSSLP
jgi:hypothetical protein